MVNNNDCNQSGHNRCHSVLRSLGLVRSVSSALISLTIMVMAFVTFFLDAYLTLSVVLCCGIAARCLIAMLPTLSVAIKSLTLALYAIFGDGSTMSVRQVIDFGTKSIHPGRQ